MNLDEFFEALNKYFIINKNDWVSIDIVGTSNNVDLVIVSDKINEREESNEYIEKCFNDLEKKYSKGIIELYTVEDAEYYGIQKKERSIKLSTWDDLVQTLYNPNLKIAEYDKKYNSRIVCFYSFKGGVGRTVALIQTAYSLALKGKNVLLIDFDIEAPSFQDVFGNNIKNMKWGLVDYLYERSIKIRDYEIQPSNIYYKLKLDDSVLGNIYIIPAGKMDAEYIHKLSYLQAKYISENNYFDNLVEQIEKSLNLDIVFIDSRTGINKWGAFSILEVADDLILFSYPNKENIHGIKVVMELLKNAKKGNLTVVLSRVDIQDQENGNALALFKELNLEQELLSLPYEPNIAVVKEYPVTIEMLEYKYMHEYDKISQFLLEDDYVKRNEYYLNNKDRKHILKKLGEELSNDDLEITTSAENKIMNNLFFNNIFIIRSNENIKESTIYKRLLTNQRKLIVVEKNRYAFNNVNKVSFQSYKNVFVKNDRFKNSSPNWPYWAIFLLYIINNENKESSNKNLKDKDFSEYFNIYPEFNLLVDALKESTLRNTEFKFIDDEKINKDKIYEKLSHKYLIVFEDLESLPQSKEWLKALWECKGNLESNGINDIGFKVIISNKFYTENKKYILENLNESSIQTLEWTKYDIQALLEKFMSLNQSLFEDYIYSINNSTNYEEFVNEYNSHEFISSIILDDKDIIVNERNDKEIIEEKMGIRESFIMNDLVDLLLGIRKVSGRYTEKVIDWFYDGLKGTNYIDKTSIVNIVKKSIEYELGSENDASTDRLINIENIRKAILELQD